MFKPADVSNVARELIVSRSFRHALMLIIPYACVLVGLDVAAHYGDATGAALPVQFFMSQDRSFGEFLEYSLTTASAVIMLLLWLRTRTMLFLTSALLFLWMTLDNSVEIHERLGFVIGAWVPPVAGLPVAPHHLAETMVFGAVGLVWLAGMAVSLRRSDATAAIYGLIIILCIAGAALFGVVVDLLTSWGDHGLALLNILSFVEDEGEFAMTILAFAISVAIFDRERATPPQPA
ncbi:hypothetical protein GV829_09840 [Sphingomonas lacunae]|uniref:Uncharacterized protein n=1 Tax=Sphingomonas lacunae TaxID=2698828 RepID=A0A6M4AU98_9SPHN|nr:hypothetical protein [Sphingomonas lacunae]QJQ32708.1 hypothetical protein GV829_09840 [Sphingomonas lacunae]